MGKEGSFSSAPNVVNKILSTTALPVTSHDAKGTYVRFQGATGSEVCQRGFSTKIGLGQHKRLVRPLVRNLERIVASHPERETSARGAHKKVWTEEEEALLSQSVVKYAGNRNINKLIAEHIPSKTMKQTSDKRRLLVKCPSDVVPSEIESDPNVGREEPPQSVDFPKEGQLKLHYCYTIRKWLSARRFANCQSAFEKILDRQDPRGVVNNVFEVCLSMLCIYAFTKVARDPKSRGSRGQRASKTTNWMQKRARKREKYL